MKESHHLFMLCEFGTLSEVQKGRWMPASARVTQFTATGATERVTIIDVTGFRLNDLTLDDFHTEIGPGALDLHKLDPEDPTQIAEGGIDLLDEMATVADCRSRPANNQLQVVIACFAVIILGELLLFCIRRVKPGPRRR